MKIGRGIVRRERRNLDRTLATYERINTHETGITETMDVYLKDFLLVVFLLPVMILDVVFKRPDSKSSDLMDERKRQ